MKRPHFDGPDYDPPLDHGRLTKQHDRIRDLMSDGEWRTLGEIAEATGDPESSVSAQLRHLRKPRFGSFVVNKRRRGNREHGLFEYQLLPPSQDGDDGVLLDVKDFEAWLGEVFEEFQSDFETVEIPLRMWIDAFARRMREEERCRSK